MSNRLNWLSFDKNGSPTVDARSSNSWGYWPVLYKSEVTMNDFMTNTYISDISKLDYISTFGYNLQEGSPDRENIEKFISFINENVLECKTIFFDLQGEGHGTDSYLKYFDNFRSKITLKNYKAKILWNINKPILYKDYDIFYTQYYELVYWHEVCNVQNLKFLNTSKRKYFLSFLNGSVRHKHHRYTMLKLLLHNREKFKECLISNLDKDIDLPFLDIGGWNEAKNKFASAESLIRDSYINLVSESEGSNPLGIFITEKSVKPFIYQQVPIFLGTTGLVKHLRQYGFDLFDDIVDHSYDNELNINVRCEMIFEQLLNLRDFDFEDYFRKNNERFFHNFTVYKNMVQENKNIHNKLRDWILNY